MKHSPYSVQRSAVLTLALFLCASILSHAATWYVRTTGNDANAGTSAAAAFLTIQKAINSATAGDVIDVGAGTFNESIMIEKSITLNGANAGVSGGGTRGTETIITGYATSGAFGAIRVDGTATVVIDGFTIEKGTTTNLRGILLGNTTMVPGPVTIKNNIITGWTTGISLAGGATSGWVDEVTITNNKFVNNGIGSTENATNLVIQDNVFQNGGLGLGGGATMAAAISGNTFTGATTGRYFAMASGVTLYTGDNLSSIVANNTFDKSVSLSEASGQWYTQAIFANISGAITAAASGATITVSSGIFTENLTVNKRLTIDGAGSGSNAASNTIITAASAGTSTIVYSVGGSDASNRQTLKDVRITGASGGTGNNNSGILISGGSMGYFTFDNITATGNSGHGLVSNVAPATSTLTDVVITGSAFSSNGAIGVRTASHSVSGFTVTNTSFTNNASLGLAFNSSDNTTAQIGGVTLTNVTFSGNSSVADLYAFRMLGSMSLTNVDFLGSNGSGLFGLYLLGGYISESTAPAIGTVTLNDVTVSGTYTSAGISFLGYSTLANVSMTDVVLNTSIPTANRGHLRLSGIAGVLSLGNTAFQTPSSVVPPLDILLNSNFGAAGSKSTVRVDATNATFDGKKGSDMTLTELYALEDLIRHGLDLTTDAPGFVRVKSGEVFVTSTSGSIQRGVTVATESDVVNVQAGTYAEGLTINKSLTLRGPNASESPNTGARVAEAILKPAGGSTGPDGITGTAANITVVVEGFTIDMVDTRWNAGYPEDDSKKYFQQTSKANTTWTFEHNIFQNTGFADNGHWLFNGSNPGLVFNLWDNLFQNTATIRNGYSNGISIWDTNPATIDIRDNVWNSTGYTAMNLNNCHGTITNNTFVENRDLSAFDPDNDWFVYQSGILLANPNFDLDITNNSFQNVGLGVVFYGNADGVINVTGNTFAGTTIASIRLSSGQYDPATNLNDVTISDNAFLNYAGTSYIVTAKELSSSRLDGQVVTATCNYFDTDDYTSVLDRTTLGAFTVAPYRIGSVTGECLGGPIRVYENATATTWISAHNSIQSAVSAATTDDGYVIRVDAGTYNENPVIHKDVTITAEGATSRRLGTSNYFVFGTTGLSTSNFSGFTTGEFDKIGVNTNGSVSEAITAVNTSGTVYLTTEVESGQTSDTEFSPITFSNKAITIEGKGTTGASCDVAPKISINGGTGVAVTSDGDANRTLKNVLLKIDATSGANFVRVTNGSIGDVTVDDVHFQRGTEQLYGLQPRITPAALNDGKDIPEFLQDGADVGYGPGKVLFSDGAPFSTTNVLAAWKGNDADANSVQTVYSYSNTTLNLSQTFLTRRPSRSVNDGAFNGNTVIGIPTSGDRLLQALTTNAITAGSAKTLFVVFRTPNSGSGNRVIYKHGDELNGMNIVYDNTGNVEFNIFNNRTAADNTFETFNLSVPANTVAIAQLYFNGDSTNRRVGAAVDYGTNTQAEAFANSTAFAATTLNAPATHNLNSAINVGALLGKTYVQTGALTTTAPANTFKGGFIAEIIVLNTAAADVRNDVYCYLHEKYALGANGNGLERAIPVYDEEEEIMAGASNIVWPNPATDRASVAFMVPESQDVTLTLVDALGRPVSTIASNYMMAGENVVDVALDGVPSGLYTIVINGFTFTTSAPVMVKK